MPTYETSLFFTVLIAAAVLALILIFFVATIIRHQRRKVATEKEKLNAEVLLLENDRARIAADLHDELGSLISAIKINLECIAGAEAADRELLEKLGGYIDTAMQRIREISNNLMPQALLLKGLETAVKDFIDMMGQTGIFQIDLECSGSLPENKEMDIHIYRIIQEIINNAAKHARSSRVTVRINTSAVMHWISISDNGIGFDGGEAEKGKLKGNGLVNIMRRVDLLRGNLFLDTGPGKGTHYLIEIPLTYD